MDWIGLGQKSYVSKFLQPFLFAQSFTSIPYCIRFGASSSPGPVAISVEEELSTYKVLRPSTITAPLQFWKDQAKQYPILSTVARRVFAMSASSAQSERPVLISRENGDWCQVAAIGIQSRVHRNSAMGDPGWTGGRAGIVDNWCLWIGLDWVRILEKIWIGLDWVGLRKLDLCPTLRDLSLCMCFLADRTGQLFVGDAILEVTQFSRSLQKLYQSSSENSFPKYREYLSVRYWICCRKIRMLHSVTYLLYYIILYYIYLFSPIHSFILFFIKKLTNATYDDIQSL